MPHRLADVHVDEEATLFGSRIFDVNWLFGTAVGLAKRPDLWRTAVRVGRVHAPDRWWTQKPYLPIPDNSWMDFRLETAFADSEARPEPDQFIEYLEWAKSWKYL